MSLEACSVCNVNDTNGKLICTICRKFFHPECLLSGQPSPIEGDIFFTLTCAACHSSGQDSLKRIKLPWVTVIHLALYNLQLHGGGKFGYFKWKDSIIAYIERYWNTLFPQEKKKTSYYGTVAGILSSWSPQVFSSGSATLGEPGWWKLTENKAPTLAQVLQSQKCTAKGKSTYKEPAANSEVNESGRSCRTRVSSIQAAIELRARRDQTLEAKEIKKRKKGESFKKVSTSIQSGEITYKDGPKRVKIRRSIEDQSAFSEPVLQEAEIDMSPKVEKPLSKAASVYSESVSHLLGDEDSDSDIEIDPCALSPLTFESTGSTVSDPTSLISTKIDQETAGTSQEWDQIMAPFCDSSLSVPDIAFNTEIKEEPFTEGYGDVEDHEGTNMSSDVTMPGVVGSFTTVKTERTDSLDFNLYNEHDTSVIKTEPDAYSRPNSSLGYSSAESEKETINTHHGNMHIQSDAEAESEVETSSQSSDTSARQKRKVKPVERVKDTVEPIPKVKCIGISVYEEKQLLQRLLSMESVVNKDPQACRLKRKLLLREQKRKNGLPCFDLDSMMNRLAGQRSQLYGIQPVKNEHTSPVKHSFPTSPPRSSDVRILDRFQTYHNVKLHKTGVSFLNKLSGTDDENLQCIRSPYTARLLKPFIRRDYESRPMKMKLLLEIQSYPHRSDPDWVPPDPPPIDYCYVQPQHIPSVNSLCREFFWPGIDLSECLQYPDFSCVVLYRKFVIGFAFMVPDVKHNEAYISFIFTHPEWRGAGIAKFMVYHLIQTCMGKDITLHVSASNSAMLLYQKFGFKPEEFVLDFYDKYFPVESKDSRHAFFLRLRR